MIHRNHQMIEFECDSCGETLNTQETEWSSALRTLKNNGWRSRKNADQWEHLCDDCEKGLS